MTIVEELRTDRESGARRLEAEYKAGLMSLARRFCADEGDAEELVNRTLAAVVEGIDDYLEQSAFFGWMCKILENLHAKDVRRKSNRTVAGDAEAVDGARDDEAGDRIFREVDASLLRDAIAELPADMKDVLMLRYFMDLPVSRVARILSAPEGTVKWRLHCARMVLAAKLGAATRRPGARLVLLALLLAAGLAVGRGVYALASAALSSRAESAEVAESPVSTASTASTVSTSSTVPTVSTASTVPTPEPPAMNAKPFLAATASLALAAAPAVSSARSLPITVYGYTGSTTLENFPVLVRLSPDTGGFDYADCAPDGSDIRFADAAGNLIPHEIDTWNPSGESAIWVALPTLERGTAFSMLFGSDAPTASAPGSVWSGAGYASVWHLDVDANGATTDSVSSYAGSVQNPDAVAATGGAGIVGGAYHCESNLGVHSVKTAAAAGFAQSAGGEATLSVWFRQIGGTMQYGKPDPDHYPNINWASQYGNCGVIVNSKNGGESGPGVELCLAGRADNWRRLVVRDSAVSHPDLDTESLYDKSWHHLAVVWDGTTRTLYLDGVPQSAAAAAATYATPSGTVRFGARDDGNKDCVWTGDLDEVRFLPSAASADWIAAEHAQLSSASFLHVGTGHRVVAKSLLMKVCGYTGSTSLERFPVLVRLTADMEGFDYADCLPNGSDIRFTDAAGNLIPHEFDIWDPNGDSAIWVAVPTLGKGTEFKMLYGPGTPVAAAPGGVWSGAGYASVWHMDIDAADGYSTTDSAGSFRGTVHDPNAAYAAGGAGVVGGAYHCESNGGVHGVATTAAAGFTQSAGGEATLSVWFRQIGGTMQNGKPDPDNYPNINWGSQYGNCGVIVNSKNGGESGPGVELCLAGYANNWKRLIVRDSAVSRPDLDTESLYDKRWHHLAVVWDGTTRTLYLDGAPQPAATAAATYGTPVGTVRMGFRDSRDTNCVWTGDIDEVRFLPSAASADWIAAEHAQVSSDSFLKVLRLSGTVIIVR